MLYKLMYILAKGSSLSLTLSSVGRVEYCITYKVLSSSISNGNMRDVRGIKTDVAELTILAGTLEGEVYKIVGVKLVNSDGSTVTTTLKIVNDGVSVIIDECQLPSMASSEYTPDQGFRTKDKYGNTGVITITGVSGVNALSIDRWGLALPNIFLTNVAPNINWNIYDFTPLALSREVSWAGFETDLQTATNSLIVADLWKKLIAWFPTAGGTAGCHRWNFRYPLDHNAAQRMLFSGVTHNSLGLGNFGGFSWAFPNVNVQSFTNSYDFAVGVTLTSNLGTILGVTKVVFFVRELTGDSAWLTINTTSGLITYGLFNGSASYAPGAPEPDYTGFRYVVKREGTNLKLFINGVLIQTTTPTFLLQSQSYTINSTFSFGGQGSGNLALECTLGNIYFGTDLSDANITTIDGIIVTLETALGR